MSEPTSFVAQTVVRLSDPAGILAKMCDHIAAHTAVRVRSDGAEVDSPYGRVDIVTKTDALSVKVAGTNATDLSVLKAVFAEHLHQFAGDDTPAFTWTGDDAARRDLPYLHELVVAGAQQLTPRMRRVILKGNTAAFDVRGYHVRVLIAPEGREPVWPTAGADGRTVWPTGPDTLRPRVYTIRSIDHERDEIAIDVVLHDGSPGSEWALDAVPGDRVGLLGPGGTGAAPKADAYVFAGDETALPAIARMLEGLPETAHAIVRLEIADAAEEQALVSPATLDLAWLHRDGAPAGTTDYLDTAVRALDWTALPENTYVFAAAEQTTTRAIRSFLDKDIGFQKSRRMAAAYWRLGAVGDDE
ncbi:DUF2218 domain-containing protein [Amorphus sp. 3PC139-8]|uniref:DUF2218 domain-containing protein n=1 Tax=Amorphus sp. 3PC139-8 TaxID=2735676 RepID=UPI00345C66FC